MKSNDYMIEAQKTLSHDFHAHLVPSSTLRRALEMAVLLGNDIDSYKKALFYGREVPLKLTDESGGYHFDDVTPELLHAAIGKFTEACELLDALIGPVFDNDKLDTTNVVEEIGDGLWYDAVGLASIGKTFDEVFTSNIAKLRTRFPGKFTTENALNRDLQGERSVLESVDHAGKTVIGIESKRVASGTSLDVVGTHGGKASFEQPLRQYIGMPKYYDSEGEAKATGYPYKAVRNELTGGQEKFELITDVQLENGDENIRRP